MPTINNIIYGFKFDSPNITYSLKSVDQSGTAKIMKLPQTFLTGRMI